MDYEKSEQDLIEAYHKVRREFIRLERDYAKQASKRNDLRLWGCCDGMKVAIRILEETFNIESKNGQTKDKTNQNV
jgi:hypothetical protein